MSSSPECFYPRSDSTYRSLLCRKNPNIIDTWQGSSYANTKSKKDAFDRVLFSKEANCTIQEWTDFTYEAIDLAYGDLLDHVPAGDRPVFSPTTTPTIIEDENGIDDLGQAWTCHVVRGPLRYAGAALRSRRTVCLAEDQSETEPVLAPRMKWSHPELKATELKADWAVCDRSIKKAYYSAAVEDPQKPLAYTIGDSKMYQKWKSDWIHGSLAEGYIDPSPAPAADGKPLQKTHNVTKERLRPLEQIATYSFRIRRLDPTLFPAAPFYKPLAGIEYKSVPWQASGPETLTVNLAIWALGCMGMNDHHRIMETSGKQPLASMVRLTKWTHDKKKMVYRNEISGREITETSWKELGNAVAFVKLDDKDGGASFTNTFVTAAKIGSVTAGLAAVSLNSTTSRVGKPAQGPANRSKPAAQAAGSSSKPTAIATAPPKQFTMAGNNGAPTYEMATSNGRKALKMGKTQVPVEWNAKKKQYYYFNPKTRKQVYFVQVQQSWP